MTEVQPSQAAELGDRTEPRTGGQPDGVLHPRGERRPSIYLRQARLSSPPSRLGWLARMMRLDQYSDVLLTPKVRTEVPILTLLLAAVFLFEFAAWSFLFNGLFVGDVDRVQPFGTVAAVLFGLVFASVILYFERQVITADTWRLTRWRRWSAQVIRLLSIAAAAYIVAHALHLVAFRVPVARILHERAVSAEEARLRRDLDSLASEALERRRAAVADELARVRSDIRTAERRREQSAAEKERYRQHVESMRTETRSRRGEVNAAEVALDRATEGFDRAALRRAQRNLESAQRRSENAGSDLHIALADQGAATAKVEEIDRQTERLRIAERRILEERSNLHWEEEDLERNKELLESRLRQWIAQLRRSPPGDLTEDWEPLKSLPEGEKQVWPEEWHRPLEFEEPKPHFFEKIAAVYELKSGRPEGQHQPAGVYRHAYYAILLIAIFLPSLVFAVKWFLMPKEVEAYFSTWHQAFAGDPGARTILNVEEKVQREGKTW